MGAVLIACRPDQSYCHCHYLVPLVFCFLSFFFQLLEEAMGRSGIQGIEREERAEGPAGKS